MLNVLQPTPTGREIEALQEVIDSRWWGMGPKVVELEEKWARYTGAKYAVATNSCTAALDIAVRIAGFNKWRCVTVSPFTFVSSALAPLNADYDVLFVDIDPESLCTPKADIQVMYAGNQFGEGVIYDMAHSAGERHRGKLSCWSFHAVKNLPAGDGGMITMNDPELYRRAKALSWCGIDKSTFERTGKKYSWDYQIEEPGLKAHMNDITAAIALCHLEVLDERNAYRKKLAHAYDEYLPAFIERPFRSSTWHLYTIQVDNRDELFDYLAENGVGCGVHYKPLYKYKFFRSRELPNTEHAFQRILSLPMHMDVTIEDIKRTCQLISAFYSTRSSHAGPSSVGLNSARPLEDLASTVELSRIIATKNSKITLESSQAVKRLESR